jgi:hypothetical protein
VLKEDMKKTMLTLLLSMLCSFGLLAQFDKELYQPVYSHRAGEEDIPFMLMAVHPALGSLATGFALAPKQPMIDTNFTRIRRKGNYHITYTYDTAAVLFFVQGITKQNAAKYEYQVLENDRILKPWGAITGFTEPFIAINDKEDPEMADLGAYKTSFGNYITVDVRLKGGQAIFTSGSAVWTPTTPQVLSVYTTAQLNEFLKVFKEQVIQESYSFFPLMGRPSPKLPVSFSSTDNNILLQFAGQITSKQMIEYKVISDKGDTGWQANQFDFNFIWLKDLPPGKYKVQVRFSFQKDQITDYDFEIKPAWHQTSAFKIIAGSLIAAFLALLLLLVRYSRLKQQQQQESSKLEKTRLSLKAIRSQLNPHFIFNTLGSIQALVNKRENDKASQYLSELGRLMRDTLDSSEKDSNNLTMEICLLDTYLKLEQLRFGFNYTIHTAEDIITSTTNIPSLLLQPLAENAVKHGISQHPETGHISIRFFRQQNDLVATITDTGGLYTQDSGNGYGLKLTRERINLLNEVWKEQPISLDILSSQQNKTTTVTLTFKNWLS